MFIDYGVATHFKYFYNWQIYLRKVAMALFLVMFPQVMYISLIGMSCWQMAAMFWVIYTLPYKSSLRNFHIIVTETFLLIIVGLNFHWIHAYNDMEYESYLWKGFICGLVTFIYLIFTVVMIVADSVVHIQKLRELCGL